MHGAAHATEKTVAVLCVAKNSVYKRMAGVDWYDETRNAATYNGPFPIVAHPPCRAWSKTCRHQSKHTEFEKSLAPLCVDLLRRFGGVLEHPAGSVLWDELNLPKPGFQPENGFWSLSVLQTWWGDPRTKSTWLLFYGIEPAHVVTPLRLVHQSDQWNNWNRLSKQQRAATSPEFAYWLIELARKARGAETR